MELVKPAAGWGGAVGVCTPRKACSQSARNIADVCGGEVPGGGAEQVRSTDGSGSQHGGGGRAGSAPSNAAERATAIRASKCLSELGIRRSSVTLAVAMGAAGGQEAGVKGVEAGKARKALPRRR